MGVGGCKLDCGASQALILDCGLGWDAEVGGCWLQFCNKYIKAHAGFEVCTPAKSTPPQASIPTCPRAAGALRLPQPQRPKQGRPVVTLQHLQLLLRRYASRPAQDLEVRGGSALHAMHAGVRASRVFLLM